ncbi:bifunctional folylpolyglutamate synthase/dihydrofolate synthase [Pediococcus acidilactici]|uniref:bifunctional folylpolyglutamate synthase/dihydrofolate synthase n=1 Tax=Pediococcus acidilactici TaxID=1254 RepID=UPI001325A5F6|nr:cyanophycin synthetase [Pediococcus acidilactici]KAF0336163.1 bifunctional folylpolyglutamate synthase/dihydrofolate synthase [Pediococcus acidilactici]KAF0338596.1 bifunctional folylpolyglutamate synthase/dihydrofolate synthase [Pediococcus acidilactici]KAF0341068.1 bifunctional folylpolyglutamate synthase/dihydrofolate synthase [Pediococcus acidilactici]KAF0346089.1 bifunctional folylpolyglutamate synthase/dihydrofolate synthase [Pediococcus acidilactici]KAF0350678.1 bifunctional folylpol
MPKTAYEELIRKLNHNMLVSHQDRIPLLKTVLAALGHPDLNYRIIHLAGTNGKGSTGAMLAKSLENAGYRVGHFSSPAMIDQREQIQINGSMIEKEAFVALYKKITQKLPSAIAPASISIFEWFTLIMLEYFAENGVEWAIIEAGLGGENDATNIIEHAAAVVFTHIDYDHVQILGDTLEQIAQNKAGIIKKDATVFIAPKQTQQVRTILEKKAVQKRATSVIQAVPGTIQVIKRSITGFKVSLHAKTTNIAATTFKLLGDYQIDNLTTVVTVYEWLFNQQVINDWQPLIEMMQHIQIPGRFQVLQRDPLVILDGAHNVDGTQALLKGLSNLNANHKLFFILGFLKDKDYSRMLHLYAKAADRIFAVQPDNPSRALRPTTIQTMLGNKVLGSYRDLHTALQQALTLADAETAIVVTGSFYLIKELEVPNVSNAN